MKCKPLDLFEDTDVPCARGHQGKASVPPFPRRNYQTADSYGYLRGNRIRKGLTVPEQRVEQSAGLVTALQYCGLSFYKVTHSSRVFPLFREYLSYFHMICSLLLLGDPGRTGTSIHPSSGQTASQPSAFALSLSFILSFCL